MRRFLLFIILGFGLSCSWPATAAEQPEPPSPPPPVLNLSVQDAVLMSLERNHSLRVQRFQPAISRTAEDQAAAAFDLNLAGEASAGRTRAQSLTADEFRNSGSQALDLGAQRFFGTGTTLDVNLNSTHSATPAASSTRLGLTVTQALLQGRGPEVNLAAIRQARLDTEVSQYELHGFAESLVAQVEQACWDFSLAVRNIEIVERSLALAEEQLAEVRTRIEVGRLAEIEAAAAEAEVALRHEALIDARSLLATTRLQLLRLINPPGGSPLDRDLTITDLPALPPIDADPVETHVALADRLRPELAQARLALARGELEVVKTRNGLLPKLDFFIGLGKSGYSSSFGKSFDPSGDGYDARAGLSLRFPFENRAARAAEQRAGLSRDQASEAIANLGQLVEVDVRGALIEINRLREQAAATAVNLRLQEIKLKAETEKFRVGKSTAFLVAQAQRDLLQAETDAVRVVAQCRKAVVELYRLEGSLLERRGIAIAE